MRCSLFSKIKIFHVFVLLVAMALSAVTSSEAATSEEKKLIKRDGKIPQAKSQQFMQQRFGLPTKKAIMLTPSLVIRPTEKAPLPAGVVAAETPDSTINNVGGAPSGFGQTFLWDRKDNQILLLIFVNAADSGGVQIQNLVVGDQVLVGNMSGIASFTEDTGNPAAAGLVGLLAAGAEVVATAYGGAALVPVIEAGNKYAQSQFKATGVKHMKRDGYGVDPSSGLKARAEGGIILCLPGNGGSVYSGDPDHKNRWIQPPGDRTDVNAPAQASGCFFPMRSDLRNNIRPVEIVDPLSSNSKCNTTGPDGLRCCHANEILSPHECRRT